MSFLSFLFGLKTPKNSVVKPLTPNEFKEHISQSKVQLIDVRTAKEYKSGRIGKAKNIDFFSASFNAEISKLHKDKPVYLYCRSGNRSKQAAKRLEGMGFTEVFDLKGGISNYS